MDEQTQKAFALGGEAETVDPVSGNDVPPGSLPEEVRDDIDAKLSEGEYVVPADVVRFFGVKFFENLRTKAKQGLQQMDEDGRIGGEPTSEMPLPFDVSELEIEDEDGMRMAIGGLIPGYAPGGFTGVGSSFGGYGINPNYKPYDPTIAPKTTTLAPPPVATTTASPAPAAMGPKIETYYRPDGTPVPITFINGKPQQSTQGLTKKNPNSMDTKETYNPLKGAKLNEFGQPINVRGEVIDPSKAGKFPFGTIDGLLGTSARYERELAELAQSDDKDKYKKMGAEGLAGAELAKNKPSFLKRAGQVLVAFGVGSVAGPAVGIAAAQGLDIFNKNRNIADSQVMLKVFESQYTGGDINASESTIGYVGPEKGSRNYALKDAYDKLKASIDSSLPKDSNMFQQVMGVLKPDVDARFAKLNLGKKSELANSYIAEAPGVQTADRSAAQVVQDKRIERAKTEWVGEPRGNKSWSKGPTKDTYKKYLDVGRQSEKITANGQVMRTQGDAYNQNRADDQSAASKRAGERSKAKNQGYKGKTGQDAVDQFNRDNADEIRTKYGGNKQTDSNGQDSGGTHCCTAAQARGDMTITEVKKLRAWHREQDMFWQEGYDVWGKVIADNLVAKSKWQSDRVRDFYDHKIYGKRTIGSMYADVVIYPMSYIIGGYKILKNTLKIKGTNYGS